MGRCFINSMNRKIIFYIVGGLLALLLLIYAGTLLNTLVKKMAVISQTGLPNIPQVASFNFEKFETLKINR